MQYSSSPAYSFTNTKKLEPPKEDPLFNPGPQDYSPIVLTIRHPKATIGNSKRFIVETEPLPGPGAYIIPSLFPKGFKYSIGHDSLENKFISTTPGPGSYKTLTKSRSCLYTFGLKPKKKEIEKSPGPGDYDLRKNEDLVKSSYIFGKAKRLLSSINAFKQLIPAPGDYKLNSNPIKIRNPKYSFGKENRKYFEIKKLDPGPGSYNHEEFIGRQGPKISISKKLKSKYIDINIGPGQYNNTDLNFYKPKAPITKIGKTKRFNILSTSPGPSDYDYIKSISLTKRTEPRCKIGTAIRRPLGKEDKNIPGPGKYNITKITGKESPQYTIRLKTKIIKDHLNPPGPGKYDIEKANIFEHHPTWKIGTEKKDIPPLEITPGVGSYNINSSRNFRPKFGYTKQKRGFLTINNNPGPGAYRIPCSFDVLNTYTRKIGNFNDEFRYV